MSFIAVAIGVGAAAGIAGGVMQSQAQDKATKANRQNVKDTNQLNYQMFRESRGEGGNAILPLYAPTGTEERLMGGAVQVYDAITGQPVQMTLDEYNRIASSMQPAVQSGDAIINAIYSGQMEQERMAQLDPVLRARRQAADADAAAIDLALSQEQNRIAAEDAMKGYAGAGSYANNRMLAATLAARQQAARQRSAATLQNATDTLALQEAQRDLQLKSLDLPMQRTNALMAWKQAPAIALAQRQAIAMQPFQFFKLNPGNAPTAQAFQQQATPSTGAVIASGVAQGAGGALNYLQNQQLIDAMKAQTSYNGSAAQIV
jgi:hypothetical protein